MTPMHWLWQGALALMVLSLAVLLPPLLRDHAAASENRNDAVLRRIYQAQWDELAREQQAGHLSAQNRAQAEDELQRRLLAELESRPAQKRWRHWSWPCCCPWLRSSCTCKWAIPRPLRGWRRPRTQGMAWPMYRSKPWP